MRDCKRNFKCPLSCPIYNRYHLKLWLIKYKIYISMFLFKRLFFWGVSVQKRIFFFSSNEEINRIRYFSTWETILFSTLWIIYTANQDVHSLTQKSSSIFPITAFKLKQETCASQFWNVYVLVGLQKCIREFLR